MYCVYLAYNNGHVLIFNHLKAASKLFSAIFIDRNCENQGENGFMLLRKHILYCACVTNSMFSVESMGFNPSLDTSANLVSLVDNSDSKCCIKLKYILRI